MHQHPSVNLNSNPGYKLSWLSKPGIRCLHEQHTQHPNCDYDHDSSFLFPTSPSDNIHWSHHANVKTCNLKNQNNNTTTAVLVTAAPFTHLPQLETCKSISQSCSWHRAASATREKRGITAETSPGAVSHGTANRSPATQTLNTHTE